MPKWTAPGDEALSDEQVTGAVDMGLRALYAPPWLYYPAQRAGTERGPATMAAVDTSSGRAALLPSPPAELKLSTSRGLLPGGPGGAIAWVYQTTDQRLALAVLRKGEWVLEPTLLAGAGESLPAAVLAGRWDGAAVEWVLWPNLGRRLAGERPPWRADPIIRRVDATTGAIDDTVVSWSMVRDDPKEPARLLGVVYLEDRQGWSYLLALPAEEGAEVAFEDRQTHVVRRVPKAPGQFRTAGTDAVVFDIHPAKMSFGSVDWAAVGVLSDSHLRLRMSAEGVLSPMPTGPRGDDVLPGVYRVGADGRLAMVPRTSYGHDGEALSITISEVRDRWLGLEIENGQAVIWDATDPAAPKQVGTLHIHDTHGRHDDFLLVPGDDGVLAFTEQGHWMTHPRAP